MGHGDWLIEKVPVNLLARRVIMVLRAAAAGLLQRTTLGERPAMSPYQAQLPLERRPAKEAEGWFLMLACCAGMGMWRNGPEAWWYLLSAYLGRHQFGLAVPACGGPGCELRGNTLRASGGLCGASQTGEQVQSLAHISIYRICCNVGSDADTRKRAHAVGR